MPCDLWELMECVCHVEHALQAYLVFRYLGMMVQKTCRHVYLIPYPDLEIVQNVNQVRLDVSGCEIESVTLCSLSRGSNSFIPLLPYFKVTLRHPDGRRFFFFSFLPERQWQELVEACHASPSQACCYVGQRDFYQFWFLLPGSLPL